MAPHTLHQPSLVAHSVKPGFIGEALSVSSRSHTSTEVAAGVKAGGKVKPGRCRRRKKRRRRRERQAPGRKLKTQKSVEVDLTFMRIDLFCLFLSSKPLRYDVWQLARFVEFGRQCSGSVAVTRSTAVIGTVLLEIHTLFYLRTPKYILNNSKKQKPDCISVLSSFV